MLNPMQNLTNGALMRGGGEGKPSKKTAAQEVLDFTQALVELTEKVRIEADAKLSAIVLPSIKEDVNVVNKLLIDETPFPPLFEEMRSKLKNIRNNLKVLSDLLSQIEL